MCNCNTNKQSFTKELLRAIQWQRGTGEEYGVYFDEGGNPYNLTVQRIKEISSICCYYVPTDFNLDNYTGEEFKKIDK